MGMRKKEYDAPEGLVRLKSSPFWWINFTYNGNLIRESTKTKDLDEAIKILQEVKEALNSIDRCSKIIVDRYVRSPGKSGE